MAMAIVGLLCGPTIGLADGIKRPPATAEALARAFYSSLEVIHATSSDPDAPDTPLLSSLKNCQIARQKRMRHPGFQTFFASKHFYASSCADGSYAVISIDRARRVKLVALYPHQRLPATAWDETIESQLPLAGPADVRRYVSVHIYLKHQVKIPEHEITVVRKPGSAYYKGTQNYVASSKPRKVRGQLRSYTITLGSRDGKRYSVASTGINYD